MNKVRRITANIPEALLRDATIVTKKGITETIIEGLKLIMRSKVYELAKALRGKLQIDIDLDTSRERKSRSRFSKKMKN